MFVFAVCLLCVAVVRMRIFVVMVVVLVWAYGLVCVAVLSCPCKCWLCGYLALVKTNFSPHSPTLTGSRLAVADVIFVVMLSLFCVCVAGGGVQLGS